MNRNEIFSTLKRHPEVPVLIVGGGINGIGTFRDLALNGVDALLVEKGDFCSGASAASSHLAHGGLPNLEDGAFRQVQAALQERNRLLLNAPHMVRPHPMVVPVFKRFSGLLNAPRKSLGRLERPAERGAAALKLGLLLYDAYARRGPLLRRHAFFSRRESLMRWKHLNPEIISTAVYQDGLILHPERLGIELVLDAEAQNPQAGALNYVSMVGGSEDTLLVRDELTDETYDVRPRLVINACGPWIDFTNRKLGLPTGFIAGMKGSHIIIKHAELRQALGDHGFFFETEGRYFAAILPLQDRVLVGTSEIPIEHPEEAYCTEGESEYFLNLTRRVFPDLAVSHEHIVFRYSGVRPLPRATARKATPTGHGHSIEVLSGDWTNLRFPVYCLVGGTWTSFRLHAEELTDKALAHLGLARQRRTPSLPIGGGRGYPRDAGEMRRQIESLSAWTGVSRERLKFLFERYGTRAEAIATYMNGGTDFMFGSLPDYSLREIIFLAQHEKICHLDDLVLRRTQLAMRGRVTGDGIEDLARALGNGLGWDEEHKAAEVARTLLILADRHGVQL